MNGKFIVIEGPDGSGTSKHCSLLENRLKINGYDVVVTAEPTDNQIGNNIRSLLKSDETLSPETLQLLFCADRAEHIASIIKPALNEGKIVICDRYSLSTIVYGTALGLDEKWLSLINDHFLKPDISFVTLPPFEVGIERMLRRSENDLFEKKEFQRKIFDGYKKSISSSCIKIDTSVEKEIAAKEIANHVINAFPDIKLSKSLE